MTARRLLEISRKQSTNCSKKSSKSQSVSHSWNRSVVQKKLEHMSPYLLELVCECKKCYFRNLRCANLSRWTRSRSQMMSELMTTHSRPKVRQTHRTRFHTFRSTKKGPSDSRIEISQMFRTISRSNRLTLRDLTDIQVNTFRSNRLTE